VKGDHGGHKKGDRAHPDRVQLAGAQVRREAVTRIRSVEFLPTILQLMGIAEGENHPVDGRAVRVTIASQQAAVLQR
jgi:hypothetical protein